MEYTLWALHRHVGSKIFPPNLQTLPPKNSLTGQIASLGVWDVTVTVDVTKSEGISKGISWHLLLGPSWVQDVGFCSDFNWCRCKLCSTAEQHMDAYSASQQWHFADCFKKEGWIFANLLKSNVFKIGMFFSRCLYFSGDILVFGVVTLLKIYERDSPCEMIGYEASMLFTCAHPSNLQFQVIPWKKHGSRQLVFPRGCGIHEESYYIVYINM